MPERVLYHNGVIYTMDRKRPQAQAILTDGDRVAVVGQESDFDGARADRRVDLGGRAVVPGLTDSHCHFGHWALGLSRVNLDGAQSLDEARQRIASRLGDGGGWLLGFGFNKNLWGDGSFPTAADLDACTGDRPAAFTSKDGHSLWVNSAALRLAGVTRDTPDPPGGAVLRDGTGAPTGVFCEQAQGLIYQAIPQPADADFDRALPPACQALLSLGVTSIGNCEGAASLRALQRLRKQDGLKLRVYQLIPREQLGEAVAVGLMPGLGDDHLRLGAIKAFADGALGSQTADMLDDYAGQPGNRGIAVLDRDAISALVGTAVTAGFSVALHAIGDRANRHALDAFAEWLPETRAKGLRHRIEHAQLIHPDDLSRFAQLGVVASVQPIHATSDRYMADRYWGARARYAYPFRTLLQHGVTLAFGSDAPIESPDPFKGIHAAVTRQREDEPAVAPWYPEERLSVWEAVHGYTLGAAYAEYSEGNKGSLEPGKLADFVVLSQDIFAVPTETIAATRAIATVVGGVVAVGALS